MLRVFAFLLIFTLYVPSTLAAFGDSSEFKLPNQQQQFVTVDQAFAFSSYQQGTQLYLDWQIKPDYYLYQERIHISAQGVTLGDYTLPHATPHNDEFFGQVHIYTQPLSIILPLKDFTAGSQVTVSYQGCAKAGFCYPPETRTIDIESFSATNNTQSTTKTETGVTQRNKINGAPESGTSTSLAQNLAEHWWTPLLFLLLGIGLAFTPCVLPMYPILTSIVLGSGKLSLRRALMLSVIYVQGMAITYTLLGLVVASAGIQFQAALQQPAVLIALSVLFILLAASMFGLYTLQLPSSAQTWLNKLSNSQKGGNSLGVLIMGAISGLVCSPCTTAPLSGALLYVAQSGDLTTGAVTLYALSIGMGIPLILAAMFGQRLLPKTGNWMNHVKTLFGFILLAAPIFLLERILPDIWITVLWSALGLVGFGWLYHVKHQAQSSSWRTSLIGIIAIIGLVVSIQPLWGVWQQSTNAIPTKTPVGEITSHLEFTRIHNVAELTDALAQAKAQGKPVMFDFYADWCVACKEFEKYTFSDPQVRQHLSQFMLLQADVTKNQPQDIKLLKHLKVLGLPTIDFWDTEGNHRTQARVSGFLSADDFLHHLNNNQL
ncbi:protein-disulfide reductase DsbD [Vibrio nitrifigilis]|uniref:Thiol:disulfide interchange protein DsbD n=1 Tax=Vibrio nitrifigilis TaxID=2789781 RepID=A0ABS0GHH5_9VIBR|nr:protein-disulfide reductase DsbD [Vibrio nitrifigilis]MBF9001849.1 protein-disulfide reductase DsbD [Vibrio nitrifigilis]